MLLLNLNFSFLLNELQCSTSCRDGSKLVYHRLPWKEPSAPYALEVLYEDDDMVSSLQFTTVHSLVNLLVSSCSFFVLIWSILHQIKNF